MHRQILKEKSGHKFSLLSSPQQKDDLRLYQKEA